MNAGPLIVRRLDAALARAEQLGARILHIDVTPADRALLTRWYTHKWRRDPAVEGDLPSLLLRRAPPAIGRALGSSD